MPIQMFVDQNIYFVSNGYISITKFSSYHVDLSNRENWKYISKVKYRPKNKTNPIFFAFNHILLSLHVTTHFMKRILRTFTIYIVILIKWKIFHLFKAWINYNQNNFDFYEYKTQNGVTLNDYKGLLLCSTFLP